MVALVAHGVRRCWNCQAVLQVVSYTSTTTDAADISCSPATSSMYVGSAESAVGIYEKHFRHTQSTTGAREGAAHCIALTKVLAD